MDDMNVSSEEMLAEKRLAKERDLLSHDPRHSDNGIRPMRGRIGAGTLERQTNVLSSGPSSPSSRAEARAQVQSGVPLESAGREPCRMPEWPERRERPIVADLPSIPLREKLGLDVYATIDRVFSGHRRIESCANTVNSLISQGDIVLARADLNCALVHARRMVVSLIKAKALVGEISKVEKIEKEKKKEESLPDSA